MHYPAKLNKAKQQQRAKHKKLHATVLTPMTIHGRESGGHQYATAEQMGKACATRLARANIRACRDLYSLSAASTLWRDVRSYLVE